jgi:hypothetical protein
MKRTVFGSIEEFRQATVADPDAGADAAIRASFETEVKADGESRKITFTISTASVDRYGDTIAVDGWQLDAFRKNPVVLWAHDSMSLPVAKAPRIWIEGGKLKAEAEFTPVGMARFNDTVFDMYRLGFLSATSVGFMPIKYAFVDDPERRYGIDFLQQELLEFSCVPVPANPDALVDGKALKAAGIDPAPLAEWCERLLDGEGKAIVAREELIRLRNAVSGRKSIFAIETPRLLSSGESEMMRKQFLRWIKSGTDRSPLVLDGGARLREFVEPADQQDIETLPPVNTDEPETTEEAETGLADEQAAAEAARARARAEVDVLKLQI